MTAAADQAVTGRAEARRFAAFVVTGGIAAAANLVARWLLGQALAYPLAVALAYLVGMVAAYLLARAYVFAPTGDRRREFARFAAVNAAGFLVVLGVSVALAERVLPAIGWHRHREDVAHLIGVMSPVVLSYYAHKRFSFGERG